jgi:hypothetical protein
MAEGLLEQKYIEKAMTCSEKNPPENHNNDSPDIAEKKLVPAVEKYKRSN